MANKSSNAQVRASINYINKQKERGARQITCMLNAELGQALTAYQQANPDFVLADYLRSQIKALLGSPT